MGRRFSRITPLLLLLAPLVSFAEEGGISLQDILGLFNIFVGLMLVAAFLAFGTGFIVWLVRLGTIQREDGLQIMSWGVAILFVLVFALAIIQFFQKNQAAAAMAAALVIIAFFVWVVIKIASEKSEKEEK